MKMMIASVLVGGMLSACGGGGEPSMVSDAIAVAEKAPPEITSNQEFEAVFKVVETPYGCPGFDLSVVGSADGKRIDKNGDVRSFSGGTGHALTFTKLDANGDAVTSVSFNSNGAVSQTRANADGTSTVLATGHNVIFLSPADVPPTGVSAGTSTTLYVGQVVYTVDANEIFTIQSFRGRAIDICAALASPT